MIRELADLERLADIPRLLSLCAARTGTELNAASMASELGIPARTVSAHLAHLATAFLIRLIPAWSTNLSAKVVRRPKLVMADVGLAAHLQGLTASGLTRPQAQFGPLLETLAATELVRQLSWSQSFATLWHFRDRSGVEVDLLLERPDGKIVGIDVKATGTPRVEDLKGLRFLAERLGDRFQFGCLQLPTQRSSRHRAMTEFLLYLAGQRPRQQMASDLTAHRRPARLMAGAYLSTDPALIADEHHALQVYGQALPELFPKVLAFLPSAHAMVMTWLRLPVTEALRRTSQRDQQAPTAEHRCYLHWVNQAYTELAQRDPQLTILDMGTLDPTEVHHAVHLALPPLGIAPAGSGATTPQCTGLPHLAGPPS